jgi:hypothetical protein
MEVKSTHNPSVIELAPRFQDCIITPKKYKLIRANILIDDNDLKQFRIRKTRLRKTSTTPNLV